MKILLWVILTLYFSGVVMFLLEWGRQMFEFKDDLRLLGAAITVLMALAGVFWSVSSWFGWAYIRRG